MLTLWTYPKSLFSIERWKGVLRNKMKRVRGPASVVRSLSQGLTLLQYKFTVDTDQPADILHVITGTGTLREALRLKKAGKVSKLIAGPNIAISPLDEKRLLCHPDIDCVLVPCPWVRDFFISQAPLLKDKVKVWAAGVADPGEPPIPRSKRLQVLIYQKNGPQELLHSIMNDLSSRDIPFSVVHYGFFTQQDYYKKLESSACMIYLSESESQGLALHEAWMRDVPTLVWNRGYWQYGEYSWKDTKISAPYLTSECGMFFKGSEDFGNQLDKFTDEYAKFKPRMYSLEHFTDLATTKKYISIAHTL